MLNILFDDHISVDYHRAVCTFLVPYRPTRAMDMYVFMAHML